MKFFFWDCMLDGNYNATLSVKILSKPATIEASITAEKDKNFIYLGVELSLLALLVFGVIVCYRRFVNGSLLVHFHTFIYR